MTNEKIKQLIEDLIPVSKEAGHAILKYYQTNNQGIQKKADTSPITKADLASNHIICQALQSLSPDIPIVSEENEDEPFSVRSQWEYCWVVDPLDGTKEFINGNGEFTTNIGLVHNHEVVAGIVYVPVSDEMFYAVKEMGAFKLINGKPVQITAQSFAPGESDLKIVCSRSHLNDSTQEFIDGFSNPELVARGSSLKFLSIAEGEAHVYPRMAPTMEWDTCAAQIILEEAGGSVLDNELNQPLRYNKSNLLNPFFIAKANEVN
ncbi:MAG: 3'(2'),5'-bisphosphate nucleotidase CysQ [Saprospiraceae bacterium]|nr:3'(2'),5'-bisphosphate nucleotidase CysQ [Saprospiraceae bacterium]